ncbi:PstS: phosphate-binding protein PstS [Desulfosarcina variabilis str. Montpellier]|uniref:phosphate ABC transporter substrate-binding protein n=1 Tax=Desulfosarcina variabilis TaxID=2300 RepID=UPI003AFB6A2C
MKKSQMGFRWVMAAAVLVLIAGGMAPVQADDLAAFDGMQGTVRISGGTAHIPVMKEAAKRIMQRYAGIQITVAGGGSGVGIKQVGEGLVDVGNSGRKPTDEEIAKYDLKLFKWAVDGVGVVVNPKNSVHSLSSEQVKAVFAGTIGNWKALGGPDKAINLYTRDEASGTRAVFWKKAIGKGPISAKANVVVSNGAMKSAVAGDPYGIGYVSVGHIDKSVTPVTLDGVTPTLETVKSGVYPVARGLFSNTKGDPTGLTKVFVDFLFSPTGQAIAAEKGFVAVN